jgi:DNA (cytosine-5)-methyltransferase 1
LDYTSIELCAGAGGAAVGFEQAGFKHIALVEIDKHACETLRVNRPNWNVIEGDLKLFSAKSYRGADLVSAGVPCPPFSKAGKQLGKDDERDLFPEAIRIVSEVRPKAVIFENVKGLLDPIFAGYREHIVQKMAEMGYQGEWKLLNASDYGTPQLRPRVIFVGLKKPYWKFFSWPEPHPEKAPSVGEVLFDLMSSAGWKGAKEWRKVANTIAPTLVGGSKKHGGPDLGPTRAKRAWEKLGVDGHGLANEPPAKDFQGLPRLTVPMAAVLQGFPSDWKFLGKKTPAYRQVGNAFPAPVARAVGMSVIQALREGDMALNQKSKGENKKPQLQLTL